MSIKKRDIDSFIDGVNKPIPKLKEDIKMSEKTKRKNFKSLTIQLSEDEYYEIVKLSEKYKQSLVGVIRFAISELNKDNS